MITRIKTKQKKVRKYSRKTAKFQVRSFKNLLTVTDINFTRHIERKISKTKVKKTAGE